MLLVFLLLAFTTQFPDGDCGASFTQRPDDPTLVIVGVNSSNVALQWKCNLTEPGASVFFLQIYRYHPDNSDNQEELSRRIGNNGDITNFQAKFGNISGTGCEVTFLIFNVTVKDGKYKYGCRVTPTKGKAKSDVIDLSVAAQPVIDRTSARFISKTEGSPFTLFCNATGPPTPTIKWKKISGAPLQFPDGETLTVNSATPEHNGTYQCTATNSAGSSLEKPWFDVIIHYKPRNATISSSGDSGGRVIEGNNVKLTCQAFDGNPDVYSYKWQHNGVNIPGGEDGTLELITVSRNKTGNYTCIANNSVAGDVNISTTLIVHYKPANANLTLLQGSSKVRWNTSVTLICSLEDSGFPQADNHSFYCDSQMSSVVHLSSNKYTFVVKENVNCSCEGSNSVGGSGKSNLVSVKVYDPPEVTLSGPTEVIEGDNVTLTCIVTGIPQPNVTWNRVLGNTNSNETISPGSCTSSLCRKINVIQPASGERYRVEDVLTLGNILDSMGGSYTCSANSIEGNDRDTINIVVKEKPANATLTLLQGSSKVRWNTEVTLICSLQDSGYPQADNYSFYCDSQISSVVHFSSNNYTFIVKENVSCSCEGSNSVGGSGRSNIVSLKVYDPPEVVLSSPTPTIIEGDTVTLTCNVTGIPQPNVTWSRVLGNSNSREIISLGNCMNILCLKSDVIQPASGERYRVEDVLTLVNITVSMEGNYTCSAHSLEGSDNDTINIVVKENPCKNSPCENNGICSVVRSTTPVDYSCTCNNPAWKGNNCSVNTDQIEAEFKITGLEYIEAYNDSNSTEFQKLAGDLESQLVKDVGVVEAEVTSFTNGSVIVQFILYYKKGKTDKEIYELLKEAVADGKIGDYIVERDSLRSPDLETATATTTTATTTVATDPVKSELPVETIIIIVVVIIIVLIIIIAVVVWKVKKKRCRKDRKAVANGEEHKLDVRQLSDPSVVPGAVGYNNPALERDYVDKGPTTATPPDDKSKKPEGLYAQVDKSKKSKNKKPGELLYADLAEFHPQTGPKPASAQQAVKKPEKQQNPNYASITDIMKERDGKSVKVPITATDQSPAQPEKPMEEKPTKEAGDGAKETPAAGKENPGSEDGDDTANLLSSKEEGTNSKN